MIIAKWQKQYETGDVLVDNQHQGLFSIINALNNAMLEGNADELLGKTIKSLQDYTIIHFDTEEEFMLRHNYPLYEDHKKKHEYLKARVQELKHQYINNLPQLTIKLSHFLTDWLINHIKSEDFKMIKFCSQNMDSVSEKSPEDNLKTNIHKHDDQLINWQKKYETGYTLIDNQHQSLFYGINALHTAMLRGKGTELLDRTLSILKDYTTIHFETEEEFMLRFNYPDYKEHKIKHELLKQKVEKFEQEKATLNQSELTINLSHFLMDWLIHHIKDEDMKMIVFLREKKE